MTNPLFIGLLVAGVVLVLGVLIYNWAQVRRLKSRRAEVSAIGPAHAARDAGHGRAEPVLGVHDADEASMPLSAAVAPAEEELLARVDEAEAQTFDPPPRALGARGRDDVAPDADIECVVWLTPPQPVLTSGLAEALTTTAAKPMRWLGRTSADAHWRAIQGAGAGPWKEISACMLLADRNGAATRDDVDAFLRLVDRVATSIDAQCVWPDERDEAGRADALDRLCADLDVQIGLTILKGESPAIAGTRLRGVAEASGFRLSSAGHFEYTNEETGAVLYSLQNIRSEPFTVESLRALAVPGIVLLLDVPRVHEPVKAFDQMRLLARRLTQTLEATLVDDNRRPLDDTSLAAIRSQVQATSAALREAHIEPGGQRALRLFG